MDCGFFDFKIIANKNCIRLARAHRLEIYWVSKSQFNKERHGLSTRTQILIYLILFAIIDTVIPVPITAIILIMALYQKPPWFKDWVDEIYRSWSYSFRVKSPPLVKQFQIYIINVNGTLVKYWNLVKLKDRDPIQLLKKAAKVLKCDPEGFKNSPRIGESDKLNRDILLYLLWQEGNYSNSKIGELFRLTHLSVTRRVAFIRKKMFQDKALGKQVIEIKSWPHSFLQAWHHWWN